MKVSPEQNSTEPLVTQTIPVKLPHGLVGFPEYKACEILVIQDQLPFLWLRLQGPESLDFVVIEPMGIIQDYEIQLFDEDAAFLEINDSNDATILNIVTVRPGVNATATVNLTAPLVLNRRTGVAKQCILENHARYSAFHPLVENDGSNTGGHR